MRSAAVLAVLAVPALSAWADHTTAGPMDNQLADSGQGVQSPAVHTAAMTPETLAYSGLRREWLEVTRTKVHDATEWTARKIDSWFGDKPFEEGGSISRGRLGLRTLWRQDESFDFNVRFSVRMDLPNVQDRAYLIIGRQNERELVTDQPDVFTRQQQLLAEDRHKDDTFFAGLGMGVRDNIDLRLGVRGGYKFYAQARYRQDWQLSAQDEIEFRETVFWSVSEGVGSTTAFDYEHAFSPSLAFRWLNAGTLSQKTDGFAWSSSVGLYKVYGTDRLLLTEALINGETGNNIGVKEYGVRVKWQQPVYRDWLIGEVILGHFWPRRDEYSERGKSWAVGAGVEMRF